jgi:phage shock protein PspC (stress-responsive transcriptional regulator)/uncharacterized integral membrane protein
VIWGVCGGLARYLNVDPTVIRLVMIFLIFADGIGILIYIIMAIIVPLESSKMAQPKETMRENVEEMRKTAGELTEEIRSTFGEKEVDAEDRDEMPRGHRNFAGIVLIVLGLLFLAANFNFFWWFDWGSLWPLLLVALGLVLILTRWRKRHE